MSLSGDREARQVLRYWLGALRFEESLASRPRAYRPGTDADPADAASSQSYFRLGAEHAAFWTSARGEAVAPMDASLGRFFRHWLRRASRRPPSIRSPDDAAGSAQGAWIAGWPAVFFERRDEIATLFRFPVSLQWRRGGAPFDPLDPAVARAGRRESPDGVVVRAARDDEDGEDAPLAIDRHLLHATLGLLEEEIAELEARWRATPDPAAMVAGLLRLLAPEAAPASPETRFRDVVQAVSRRLPPGASVYPTGIIQDGALVFATHHLQRELLELVSLPQGAAPLQPGTPLWAYLTGAPSASGRAMLRGRLRPRALTAGQRDAAELALGSRLAALQGPPGTGKTELILGLAAHALVARIEGWDRGGPMSGGLLVVASTNNRAVDNAIDPIGSQMPDDRLPFALRAGNQELTRTTTARELRRALAWLTAQAGADAAGRLDEARGGLRLASRELGEIAAPHEARLRRDSRLRAIRHELAALPPERGDAGEDAALRGGLLALRDTLATMARNVRARRTKVEKVAARWARVAVDQVAPLLRLRPDLASAFALPPAVEGSTGPAAARQAWREALEEALEEVEDVRRQLRDGERAVARRASLLGELRELEDGPAPLSLDAATGEEIEARAHALFLCALEVRERWAIACRDALLPALEKAAEAAFKARTIRHVLDGDAAGLRALYPVIGCTLLSLGNVFEDATRGIDTLVIDEAGQCHPAFPAGGLARARRAVLIGDVQQLAPVMTLSSRDEARVRRAARIDLDEERFAPFVIHDRAGTSAQALADRAVVERPTLVDHFRCQRAIITLSDELCGYRLAVHTPERSLSERLPRLAAPVLFEAVPGAQARARGSWANEAEAERLVELLLELHAAGLALSDVGVLTPYVGQHELLRRLLRRRGIPLEEMGEEIQAVQPEALAIGTVHRLQGGERSVILLSTTISRPGDLAFIDERANLLNVAISRARDHLVTFGCEEVLRAGRRTRLLVERAERLPGRR